MRTPSTASSLRRLFTEVLAASAALGASACGSGTAVNGANLDGGGADGPVTEPGFSSLCSNGQVTATIEDIVIDPPVDYLAYYQETWFPPDPDAGAPDAADPNPWKGTTSSKTGTPCATATNKTACQSKLDAQRVLPTDA